MWSRNGVAAARMAQSIMYCLGPCYKWDASQNRNVVLGYVLQDSK